MSKSIETENISFIWYVLIAFICGFAAAMLANSELPILFPL